MGFILEGIFGFFAGAISQVMAEGKPWWVQVLWILAPAAFLIVLVGFVWLLLALAF